MDLQEVYNQLQKEIEASSAKRKELLAEAEKLDKELEILNEIIEPFHKHFGPKEAKVETGMIINGERFS